MADDTALAEPAQGFAALMNEAAGAAEAGDEAPYGWTTDRATGERRPKRSPGRPRKPPSLEELKAAKAEEGEAPEPEPDKAPGSSKPKGGKPGGPLKAPADTVPYRPGVIATGVNKLYRRAGKIVRAMDPDIGEAIIACTRKEDDDDITVGEAWDQLARANPRIRAWLMRVISGGAWSDLVMAHAPIGMAIVMKPAIAGRLFPEPKDGQPPRRGPFARLAASMLEPDEDTRPSDLRPADADAMFAVAEQQARRVAERMGLGPVSEADMAQAREMVAAQLGGPPGVPAAFVRSQPKRQTRAARRGK